MLMVRQRAKTIAILMVQPTSSSDEVAIEAITYTIHWHIYIFVYIIIIDLSPFPLGLVLSLDIACL